MAGILHRINVSAGGVPKLPVSHAEITPAGIVGDSQAKKGIHGGIYKAVSLFSLEHIEALRHEGHEVSAGALGENLTVSGFEWEKLAPGVELVIANAVRLKITMYALPCVQIAGCFTDGDFSRVHHRKHPGWSRLYAQVLEGGSVSVGDAVICVDI